MKNKKTNRLFILLFSLLTIQDGYCIGMDSKDNSYPVEIKSYSLEQRSPDERITLQDYGMDKNVNHKYGVTFVGDVGEKNAGFNLHMIDENNAPCELVSLENSFSPPKQEKGVETLPQVSWTVTNSINKVCHPRFYSVIAEGSGFVKFENIPMPEIQINLDNTQNENKQLTITNISTKQIELINITNTKGEKETSVEFKDPVVINSGASQSMVLKPPAICKPARGNYKGRYSFNIVYKVDGETKTSPIGIGYSCDWELEKIKDLALGTTNEQQPDMSFIQKHPFITGEAALLGIGGLAYGAHAFNVANQTISAKAAKISKLAIAARAAANRAKAAHALAEKKPCSQPEIDKVEQLYIYALGAAERGEKVNGNTKMILSAVSKRKYSEYSKEINKVYDNEINNIVSKYLREAHECANAAKDYANQAEEIAKKCRISGDGDEHATLPVNNDVNEDMSSDAVFPDGAECCDHRTYHNAGEARSSASAGSSRPCVGSAPPPGAGLGGPSESDINTDDQYVENDTTTQLSPPAAGNNDKKTGGEDYQSSPPPSVESKAGQEFKKAQQELNYFWAWPSGSIFPTFDTLDEGFSSFGSPTIQTSNFGLPTKGTSSDPMMRLKDQASASTIYQNSQAPYFVENIKYQGKASRYQEYPKYNVPPAYTVPRITLNMFRYQR